MGEITETIMSHHDLGTCCACGQPDPTVRNIMLLHFKSPLAGTGWGCVLCKLPSDGAIAVICDECLELEITIKEACRGFILTKERIPLSELTEPFNHREGVHADEDYEMYCTRCGNECTAEYALAADSQPESNGVQRIQSGALITNGTVYCNQCGPDVAICRTCGCTDEAGCPQGCYWFAEDLCSRCHFSVEFDDSLKN